MKIERTYLYNSDVTENMQNLYNYLLENAVPEYFDNIEISENKLTISLYTGENKFLEIKKNGNAIVAYVNTVTMTIGRAYYTDSPVFITYVYKCGNSISLCASEETSDTMNKKIKLTITKDNEGNTAVICISDYLIVTGPNKTNKIYIGSEKSSNVLSLLACVNSSGQTLTAKIPFFVGNTGNYTPDVFLTPYTEYSTPGILEMDGVHYVSNGLWCCKE